MISIETKCLHLEEETESKDEKAACLHYGSLSFPIYQTATYAHPGVGKSTFAQAIAQFYDEKMHKILKYIR